MINPSSSLALWASSSQCEEDIELPIRWVVCVCRAKAPVPFHVCLPRVVLWHFLLCGRYLHVLLVTRPLISSLSLVPPHLLSALCLALKGCSREGLHRCLFKAFLFLCERKLLQTAVTGKVLIRICLYLLFLIDFLHSSFLIHLKIVGFASFFPDKLMWH